MKISKKTMIEAIKDFLVKSNGIFLLNTRSTPVDIATYYHEITDDFEMKKLREDKKNMKGDGVMLKKDIKKAIDAYYSEVTNG